MRACTTGLLALALGCAGGGKDGPPAPGDTGTGASGSGGDASDGGGGTDGDADGDGHPAETDCDDTDPATHPGATERCDGVDNDCNGRIDDTGAVPVPIWEDADGDGFGTGPVLGLGCVGPAAHQAAVDGDCDDSDPLLTPAHFIAPDGSHGDVSALLWGDDPTTVTALRWDQPGTLRLCPGDWRVALEVAADLAIEGPLPGTALSGATTHTPLAVAGDGIRLAVQGVDLRHGRATHTGPSPFDETLLSGGNLFCDGRSEVILEDLEVEGGSAAQGGGLFLAGRCAAALTGVLLRQNRATGLGGGLGAVRADAVALTDTTFADNQADLGGALGLSGGSLAWTGGGAHDNQGRWGAVWTERATLQLTGLAVDDNAGERCGALCLRDGWLTLASSTLDRNRALRPSPTSVQEGGGALYLYEVEATLRATTFADNQADGDGGAVRADLGATLELVGGGFTGNSAGASGGAISFGGRTLTASGTVFSTNTAVRGGALHGDHSLADATLTGGQLTDNHARSGGAVAWDGDQLELDGVDLTDNEATRDGGALTLGRGSLRLTGGQLARNQAHDGGALHLWSATATLDATVLDENVAATTGGAVALDVNGALVLVSTAATSNRAATGGALWLHRSATAQGSGLMFSENSPEDVVSELSGALELASATTLDCDAGGCR